MPHARDVTQSGEANQGTVCSPGGLRANANKLWEDQRYSVIDREVSFQSYDVRFRASEYYEPVLKDT